MPCSTCKYFAVPLDEAERREARCPGADPLGDPARKRCVLEGTEGFTVSPGGTDCKQYVPVFMRFR